MTIKTLSVPATADRRRTRWSSWGEAGKREARRVGGMVEGLETRFGAGIWAEEVRLSR